MTVRRIRPGSPAYPPYFPSGEGMRARLFDDGASEYLYRATAVLTGYPLAMAVWFNSDDLTSLQCLVGVGYAADVENYAQLFLSGQVGGDPVTYQPRRPGAINTIHTTTGYAANTWHHACGLSYADDDHAVFIDGGSKGTGNNDVTPSQVWNSTYIGMARDSTPNYPMSGAIAFAAIWDLTNWPGATGAAKGGNFEATALPLLARGAYPWEFRPETLAGLWLAGPQNDRDYSGRGYHMTAFNTPSWALGPPQVQTPLWSVPKGFVAAAPAVGPFLTTGGGYSLPVG